jgi:DNA-binding transcriptional ArsR family regulator
MTKSPAVITQQWLTLSEALEALGKSQSTLERLAGRGEIQTKLQPVPGRKSERLYLASDVARHKGEVSQQAPSRSAPSVKKLTEHVSISSLENVLTRWRDTTPVAEKLWLRVDEAASFCGLTESYLVKLRREGKVVAIRGGERGSWVYLKESLEAWSKTHLA